MSSPTFCVNRLLGPIVLSLTITSPPIEGGEVIVKDKTIGPNSRFTQNVGDDIGPNKNVSIQVVGKTNSDKTICERPMYFTYKPGQLNWTGGHDSPGATQL